MINTMLDDEVSTPDTYCTAERLKTFPFITIFTFEFIVNIVNCLLLLIFHQAVSKYK